MSQILHVNGIESVIIEHKSRARVEGRIRAGVLEQGTVDLLRDVGVDQRLARQGLVHDGIGVVHEGVLHNINFRELTGKSVTIYGQTELTRDLIDARLAAGGVIHFDAKSAVICDPESNRPSIRYQDGETPRHVECDFIAGCDGFYGISRSSLPADRVNSYQRSYPFAWLGILAQAPPPSAKLIYARSARGFALFSMRSRTVVRNYLQCDPDEDLSQWPDPRVWEELRRRLGEEHGGLIEEGRVMEKSVIQMRSFVVEPMQYGRLFLAGDAAHIVPPTGAKGLNLAAADVNYLGEALTQFYRSGNRQGLDSYTETALNRVWKAQRFSWWMTSLLHSFPEREAFQNRMHATELDYVLKSTAAMISLSENYVGLPLR